MGMQKKRLSHCPTLWSTSMMSSTPVHPNWYFYSNPAILRRNESDFKTKFSAQSAGVFFLLARNKRSNQWLKVEQCTTCEFTADEACRSWRLELILHHFWAQIVVTCHFEHSLTVVFCTCLLLTSPLFLTVSIFQTQNIVNSVWWSLNAQRKFCGANAFDWKSKGGQVLPQ